MVLIVMKLSVVMERLAGQLILLSMMARKLMLVRLQVLLLMLSEFSMLTEMSVWLSVLLLWLLEVLFGVVVN
jgi:hypothetical protein